MSLICKNEKGIIAVNNKVIINLIIDELISMSNDLIPCNKKGKIIKNNPTPFIDADYSDSVNIYDTRKQSLLRIYIVVKFGKSITDITDELLDKVEGVYELFNLKKPETISICIKGIMTNQIVKRNIEVTRRA